MKNKTKKALCAASILGVVAISGIFAYLTDTDSKTNNFTVGNVDIELLEPAWEIVEDDESTTDVNESNDKNNNGIPDFAENIVPGQVIEKDPQIKNVGANDAYVFLKVTVPTYKVKGKISQMNPFFNYEIDEENWMQIGGVCTNDDGDEVVYYAYKAVLPTDDTDNANVTAPLFDSVQVDNPDSSLYIENIITEGEVDIKIDAYAIQCDAIPNADDIDPTDEQDMVDVFNIISVQDHLDDELVGGGR